MIHEMLARELGVFHLGDERHHFPERCREHLLTADTYGALDMIELSFRLIDAIGSTMTASRRKHYEILQEPEEAIAELNQRFQQHNIGYRYESGELIRVDSQYAHQEIVKPAIALLQDAGFRGASDEFSRAHEHYRKGRHKEAVAEALKAFESTMKAICDVRGWACRKSDTAIPLIKVLCDNGLISKELESHFGALRSAMESGLPTLSNRTSRHGQGREPTEVPDYMVAYALHLAASNIVFLVEAHKRTG